MPQSATAATRFAAPGGLPLEASFDLGQLTSDGGLPWLQEADDDLGLGGALAAAIRDWRRGPVRHALPTLVRQRVLQIACGDADQDDADALRTCGRILALHRARGAPVPAAAAAQDPRAMPFAARRRHRSWSADIRSVEDHALGPGKPVSAISILEHVGRALPATATSPRQDPAASPIVLRAAVATHGAPEALVSDGGSGFKTSPTGSGRPIGNVPPRCAAGCGAPGARRPSWTAASACARCAGSTPPGPPASAPGGSTPRGGWPERGPPRGSTAQR